MTCYKKDKFKLVESTKKFPIDNKTNPVKAIHCILLHLESNEEICFLNIHLKAGYRSGEDRRVVEINRCLEFLETKKYKRVCICGDFNDDLAEREGRKLAAILKGKFNFDVRPKTCCFTYEDSDDIHYSSFPYLLPLIKS